MCGIAGIFAYRDGAPPVDESELLRIREKMVKRGPDGAGLWISPDRKVGLAHRRLVIIDLSESGAQPMTVADGGLTITFNGEIYNFKELRSELEAKGHVFRSASDTEVLLRLYQERGAAMVQRLRGTYAFAIWDAGEQALFLARDPFGVKPLYYADNGKALRFASQVRALAEGGGLTTNADVAGWAGFFLWGAVPEPLTTHREIRALPAGCTLKISALGGSKVRSAISVVEELRGAYQRGNSAGRENESLHDILDDSVQAHLVADVPIGLFLSAGIDSGALARLASSHVKGMRAITIGFEDFRGGEQDETLEAETLATELGLVHEIRWIDAAEFASVRDAFLLAMDQPTIDGLNTYLVSMVAAKAGLKVVLSGLGGDELFGGYPSFWQVPWLVRMLGWSRRLPVFGHAFRSATVAAFMRLGVPKYAGLLEYGSTFSGAYLLRRAIYMPWELSKLMAPDAARLGLEQLAGMASAEALISPLRQDRAKIIALESSIYMRNMLLRDADWASMAHSLEIRVPFVDVKVLRYVAERLAGGTQLSKSDLAHAVIGARTKRRHRFRKRAFVVPMDVWTGSSKRVRSGGRGTRNWALTVARSMRCEVLDVHKSLGF